MRAYIIRRLLLTIPTLFVVTLVIFFGIRIIPGDLIDIMISEMGTSIGEIGRADIEKELGLDVPIFIQYGRWIGVVPNAEGLVNGLLQGDLGNSLWTKSPVSYEITPRWPVTLELGIMGMIISILIAMPIGILSAVRQNSWGDHLGRSFAVTTMSVPDFWLGTMVVVFPSIWWAWSPPLIITRFTEDPIENLQMFLIPAIVLGITFTGVLMRLTRTAMLDVLRQDYIRTAWSKGLRERVVIIRHGLKNALIPVVTLIGMRVPILIGGTVIIERIFGLPGLGRLLVDNVTLRDYPIVTAVSLLYAIITLLSNLVVDLTYGFLNPKIRYN
jgi:peptide/nickel transport system permease protein